MSDDTCVVCGRITSPVDYIGLCRKCEYNFRSRGIRGTRPLEVAAWASSRLKEVVAKKILGLEAENAVLNERATKHSIITDTAAIIANKNEEIILFQAEIAELKAEVERLEKLALVWHKWPDEKPGSTGYYLTFHDGYKPAFASSWFISNERDTRWSSPVQFWAEIPEPEEK